MSEYTRMIRWNHLLFSTKKQTNNNSPRLFNVHFGLFPIGHLNVPLDLFG